jgi:hypothetical protein
MTSPMYCIGIALEVQNPVANNRCIASIARAECPIYRKRSIEDTQNTQQELIRA